MNLFEYYELIRSKASEITCSSFLSCLSKPIKFIDLDKFSEDKVVQEYKNELKIMLEKKDFGLTSRLINEFAQKMGEVHFYCLCLERDIVLNKIKESKKISTPDFSFLDGEKEFYFEVKTPSVVGGDKGLEEDIETGFKVKHYLSEGQNRSAITELKPYGEMVEKYGHIRSSIKVLSEKIVQNYKSKQFLKKNTFLVVNLSMIHNLITEPEELNPVYSLRKCRHIVVSGIFWMMAFRKVGMAVFGVPLKTHGFKHGIDGYCDDNGILINYEEIEGILLVTNPPEVKSEIWGLFRDKTLCSSSDDIKTLIKFTDYRYNDEINSRGMCNDESNRDYSYNKKV